MSYNLRFHTAYHELEDIVRTHKVDVLCLQECLASDLKTSIGELRLGAVTNKGSQGMAIYYHPDKFALGKDESYELPESRFETWFSEEERQRLLTLQLRQADGSSLLIANIHATHLVATNSLRRKQIAAAFDMLNSQSDNGPAVLIGDYNYPFFIKRLRKGIEQAGFRFVGSTHPTFKSRFFKGYFDFVSFRNMQLHSIARLPFNTSDHAPILADMIVEKEQTYAK